MSSSTPSNERSAAPSEPDSPSPSSDDTSADETQLPKIKASLEIKKLKLEIHALRRAFRRNLTTAVIAGAVSFGVATVGWMFNQALSRGDREEREKKRREEDFARTLEQFGSKEVSMRVRAAIALRLHARDTNLTNEAVAALVARLATEEDSSVSRAIVEGLSDMGKPALHATVKANRRAAIDMARSTARYVAVRKSSKPAPTSEQAVLDLSTYIRRRGYAFEEDMQRSDEGSFELQETLRYVLKPAYDKESSLYSKETSVQTTNVETSGDPLRVALDDVANSARHLVSTSVTLSGLLHKLSGQFENERLDGVVLIGGNHRKLSLRGASLRAAFIRGTFEHADLSHTDLSHADLRSASLGRSQMSAATLDSTHLPDLTLLQDSGTLPDLTAANWWDAKEYDAAGKEIDINHLEYIFPKNIQLQQRASPVKTQRKSD